MHKLLAGLVFQAFQCLRNGFGLAGQVDDKAVVTYHGNLARENGSWHKMQADLPHLLAKTGHFFFANCQRRFRCHVALGWAGATSGEYEVAPDIIHQIYQGVFDEYLLCLLYTSRCV